MTTGNKTMMDSMNEDLMVSPEKFSTALSFSSLEAEKISFINFLSMVSAVFAFALFFFFFTLKAKLR